MFISYDHQNIVRDFRESRRERHSKKLGSNNERCCFVYLWHVLCAAITQTAWRIATGWTVLGWNSIAGKLFTPNQISPGQHAAFCTVGSGSFPGVQRSVCGVDHPPHLMPRIRNGRALHPVMERLLFQNIPKRNLSDTFLSTRTLLYISVRLIFINRIRFLRIPNTMRILYKTSNLTDW